MKEMPGAVPISELGTSVTLWAQNPPDVARRLLAKDGIQYIKLVGSRDGFQFSLGYRDEFDGEHSDKAVLIELEGVYSSVYGCSGVALWFIIREPTLPDGEVHDHVEISNDIVDDVGEKFEIPIDTPRCGGRVFTFEELGISVGDGEDDRAPVLGNRSAALPLLKDGSTAGGMLMPSRTTQPPRTIGDPLTLEQVAEILCLRPRAVVDLVHRGELDGQRIGRSWEFTQAAIDRFFEGVPAWRAADFASWAK